MSLRRRYRRYAGIFALLIVLSGAITAYAPSVLPRVVQQSIRTVLKNAEPARMLPLIGIAIGLLGVVASWTWRAQERAGELGAREVEEPDRDVAISGADLTALFEWQAEGRDRSSPPSLDGGPAARGSADPRRLEDQISNSLRSILIDTHLQTCEDRKAAQQYVDEGRWTDDQYAAAFVSESDAVDVALPDRLYAWLYPGRAYERRARRALRAVEDVCDQRLVDATAPSRSPGWLERIQAALTWGNRGDEQE